MEKETVLVILAAGKGTRMKSEKPKILHEVLGRPMVDYVMTSARALGLTRQYLVVGYGEELIRAHFGDAVTYVVQREQLGTGHALQQVLPHLEGFDGDVLVLSGDMPLITEWMLQELLAAHRGKGAPITMLTASLPWKNEFGKIVRAGDGRVGRIVEAREATNEEKGILEVNLGTYCFQSDFLGEYLPRIGLPNVQKELYLTDLVILANRDGMPVEAVVSDDPHSSMGVNNRKDLAAISAILRQRINDRHMEEGVTLIDPGTTFIEPDVVIGRDTVIHPSTMLEKGAVIGAGCTIGPFTRISASRIGDRVTVQNSIVVEAEVEEEASVGPFAYLRPGASIGPRAKVGDFVEIKKSRIGEGSKVPHLSYIGDASIGRKVNVGAGTITCNYDGVQKHRTTIEDGVRIGSNTNLVAPVTVGRDATTGAGAVVMHDVPEGALAVGVPAVVKERKKKAVSPAEA